MREWLKNRIDEVKDLIYAFDGNVEMRPSVEEMGMTWAQFFVDGDDEMCREVYICDIDHYVEFKEHIDRLINDAKEGSLN